MQSKRRTNPTVQNDSSVPLKLEVVESAILKLCELHDVPAGALNVLVTGDDQVRRLNLTFRGIDSTTDVLTFPSPAGVEGEAGDIAISIEFARRQAELRNVPVIEEVAMLAIHGGLHLAGYDDSTEEQRAEMVARMNEVASACGLTVDEEWSSLPHEAGA